MRIGIIAPPWVPVPPRSYGGIESVVDLLARGLVAERHDVLLAASGDSTCPVPRVPGFPAAAVRGDLTDHVTEMRHVVRAYAAMTDVDIVHDHTVAGPLLRQRPADLPVVTTNHGTFVSALGDIYRAMDDVAIIAISHHQASTATGVSIARVIHHGIDVDRVPVGAGDGGYAAFLGRMSPDKGPREAVLIARRAGIPLRIAAKMRERSERDYYEQCIVPLLGSDIEYVGEIGDSEKFELLGGAVALLNPIQWPEPFGLVMIEALATGTPVIATRAGSAPEIVDDGVTGIICDELSDMPAALGKATELDREACRTAAATTFSAARMVRDHVQLYSDVIASRAGRAVSLSS